MRGPLLLWRLHDTCSICATVVKERLRLCGTVCECDHSNTSSMVPPPMALEPKPLALEPPNPEHEMVEEAEGYELFLSGKSVSGYKRVTTTPEGKYQVRSTMTSSGRMWALARMIRR